MSEPGSGPGAGVVAVTVCSRTPDRWELRWTRASEHLTSFSLDESHSFARTSSVAIGAAPLVLTFPSGGRRGVFLSHLADSCWPNTPRSRAGRYRAHDRRIPRSLPGRSTFVHDHVDLRWRTGASFERFELHTGPPTQRISLVLACHLRHRDFHRARIGRALASSVALRRSG